MATNWTTELKEEMKVLWADNSATKIAAILNERYGTNYTRNQIVGVLHRAGVTHKDKSEVHPQTRDDKRPARKPRLHIIRSAGNSPNKFRIIETITGEVGRLREVPVEPRHLTLMELEADSCRYPYDGDGGGFTFCGHICLEGSSYCGPHRILCRAIPKPPHSTGFVKWGRVA